MRVRQSSEGATPLPTRACSVSNWNSLTLAGVVVAIDPTHPNIACACTIITDCQAISPQLLTSHGSPRHHRALLRSPVPRSIPIEPAAPLRPDLPRLRAWALLGRRPASPASTLSRRRPSSLHHAPQQTKLPSCRRRCSVRTTRQAGDVFVNFVGDEERGY
jgi:hypothetical protein